MPDLRLRDVMSRHVHSIRNTERLANADGFGIGSALYKPGMTRDDLAQKAAAFVTAVRSI